VTGAVSVFTSERAPCGRMVGGERTIEDDHEGLLVDGVFYACGCRRVREVFHDGSVQMQVIRHDGRVLADEHSAAHEG
jgi:hypothetical protein